MPTGHRKKEKVKNKNKASSQYSLLSSRHERKAAAASPRRVGMNPKRMKLLIYEGLGRSEEKTSETAGSDEEGLTDMDFVPESPNAESPLIRSEKLEEIDLDLRANDDLIYQGGSLNLFKKVAVLLAAGLRSSVFICFLYGYVQYGGMTFFLVFALSLFFVAYPIAVLELALGQYSSLPPIKLFSSLSISATATGILIVLYRLSVIGTEVLDARPVNAIVENILMNSEEMWSSICRLTHDPLCSYVIESNETFVVWSHGFGGLPADTSSDSFRRWKQLAPNPHITVSAPDLYQLTMKKYDIRHFVSVQGLLAVAGVIGYSGMNVFGSFSLVMTIIPLSNMVYESVSYATYNNQLLSALTFDWTYLLHLKAYAYAISLSFQFLSVGNGSWFILGTLSSYKANIFTPALLCCVVIIVAVLASAVAELPMFVGYCEMEMPDMPPQHHMDRLLLLPLIKWLDMIYYQLYMMSPKGYSIFYLSISAVTVLPYIVLTIELVVQTVYRLAPALYRLPGAVVRMCIINTLLSTMILYQYMFGFSGKFINYMKNLNARTMLVSQMTVLLMEVFMIAHVYRDTRVLINIRAMMKQQLLTITRFYFAWMTVFRHAWRFFCPTVLMMCLMHQLAVGNKSHASSFMTVSGRCILLVAVLSVQLFVTIYGVTWTRIRGLPVWTLFAPRARWGPANLDERRGAERLERAANIY